MRVGLVDRAASHPLCTCHVLLCLRDFDRAPCSFRGSVDLDSHHPFSTKSTAVACWRLMCHDFCVFVRRCGGNELFVPCAANRCSRAFSGRFLVISSCRRSFYRIFMRSWPHSPVFAVCCLVQIRDCASRPHVFPATTMLFVRVVDFVGGFERRPTRCVLCSCLRSWFRCGDFVVCARR